MQSPPLHLASPTHYCCSGDVSVAETAVVGAGTVLQALPNSQIRILEGACIGAGVVIQAKSGTLVIEAQASLGTGVLLVGHGYIGRAATVGPASTLINPAVAAHAIVAPHTLQGGGQSSGASGVAAGVVSGGAAPAESASSFDPNQPSGPQTVPLTPRTTTPIEPQPVEPKPVKTAGIGGGSSSHLARPTPVYGRDQVNGLLSALFPHRQSLNGSGNNGSSNSGHNFSGSAPSPDEDSVW